MSLQRSTAAGQAPLHALRPWRKRRLRRTRLHRRRRRRRRRRHCRCRDGTGRCAHVCACNAHARAEPPPPFLTTHFGGDSDGLGWLAGAKRGRAYSDAGTSCDTDLESVLQASRYNYSYFVHILHILIYCI